MQPLIRMALSLLIIVLLLGIATRAGADDIRVAVASNFVNTLTPIADLFQHQHAHRVVLISGSTGKHYAQISQGAPYDVFFAADEASVAELLKDGKAVAATDFIYAIGKLIAWTRDHSSPRPEPGMLRGGSYERVAIANPKLAPYGRAAQQVLSGLGMWDQIQPRLLRGENIAQTYHFVRTGGASLGFIAYAQIKRPGTPAVGQWWDIPAQLYDPIRQRAVLLRDSPRAREFLAFCRSEPALRLIRASGYDIPDGDL